MKRDPGQALETHLLDQAQAALVSLSLDARVTQWNRYASVLFGHDHSDALGAKVPELIFAPSEHREFQKAFDGAAAGTSTELQLRTSAAEPGRAYVHVTMSPLLDENSTIEGVLLFALDITERVKAEQRLEVHYEIASTLSESEHIYEAAPRILQAICRSLEWSYGGLWRVDRIADELRCLELWHAGTDETALFADASRWISIPKGTPVPGRVWAERTALWIPDILLEKDFSRKAAADEAELRSAVAFPILLRGEVLGVLEFFSPEIREPDEQLLDLMSAIGSQVGQFLERKQAEDDRSMSEARKTAILESTLDCIITIDHLGYVLEFNAAAEEVFGFKREEAVGKEMAGLIIPEQLRDAHRKGLLHYLEGGTGRVVGRRMELMGLRADGSEFPVELTVSRVDIPGPPVFCGILRDITQRKESELERLHLLEAEQQARADAEKASARLARLQRITDAALAYLQVDDLLDEVLERTRETLGCDVSAILMMREEQEDLTVRAIKGLDIDVSRIRPVPLGEQIAGKVAQTGQPMIVEDLTESNLQAPVLRAAGMRALVSAPLVLENRTIGVLVAASAEAGHFTDDDLDLLRLAGDRIVYPIHNAGIFEREHQIATTLQRSLLPDRLPEIPGLQMKASYEPGGKGVDVGGDWYDALELPDGKVGVMIGDVVGKGVRAAAVMGQVRNALRAYALGGGSPGEVVGLLNRLTDSFDRATMATLIYLIYDPATHTAHLTSAGHPPPVIARPDGTVTFLGEERNLPLGVDAEHLYVSETEIVEPGSILLLYTDGLIEEPGEGIDEGMDRLLAAVREGPREPGPLCDHVLREVFRDRDRADDVALLAVGIEPA